MSEFNLISYYKKDPVPPPLEIARAVVEKEIRGKSTETIKNNFDGLIDSLQAAAFKLYLSLEKVKVSDAIRRYFTDLKKKQDIKDPDTIIDLVANHLDQFDKLFLSISQSRRSRAGSTFEFIITSLFRKLEYPFSMRPIINGEPDFLLPSVEYYRELPTACVIFTAKRTLRERWRQIISEGTRGLGFYLATIDRSITEPQLKEMIKNRIYLVVPAGIKEEMYRERINVISFKEFFELHLDSAMKKWKRAGILK